MGVRATVTVLAAFVGLAGWPAVSVAGQEVISTTGSLSSIYVDEDLGCQVQASGDAAPSFFGGTDPGACGTFLSYTEGELLTEAGSHHLFGPTVPGGVTPEEAFKTVSPRRSRAAARKATPTRSPPSWARTSPTTAGNSRWRKSQRSTNT